MYLLLRMPLVTDWIVRWFISKERKEPLSQASLSTSLYMSSLNTFSLSKLIRLILMHEELLGETLLIKRQSKGRPLIKREGKG